VSDEKSGIKDFADAKVSRDSKSTASMQWCLSLCYAESLGLQTLKEKAALVVACAQLLRGVCCAVERMT
jgi:hypothetical protein